MPDASELQSMIAAAERAASSGDLESAESLLGEAARQQEADLGAFHPDLAKTLNNLGVVREMANKLPEAEQSFRRAYEIASKSLDPQDPLVSTSARNLREFCFAHGTPVGWLVSDHDSEITPLVEDHQSLIAAPAGSPPAATVDSADSWTADSAPVADPIEAAVRPDRHERSTWAGPSRWPRALVAGGVAAAALLVLAAAWSVRLQPAVRPGEANVPPSFAEPEPHAQEAAALDRPSEPTRPAANAPSKDVPSPTRTTNVRVTEAAICQHLSTGESQWRCSPPSTPAAPGQLSFYTRVAAPANIRIHHRWFQGTLLRRDAVLSVRANPDPGYRTFSRQTVDSDGGGEWRVEITTAEGVRLHEERFVVR